MAFVSEMELIYKSYPSGPLVRHPVVECRGASINSIQHSTFILEKRNLSSIHPNSLKPLPITGEFFIATISNVRAHCIATEIEFYDKTVHITVRKTFVEVVDPSVDFTFPSQYEKQEEDDIDLTQELGL